MCKGVFYVELVMVLWEGVWKADEIYAHFVEAHAKGGVNGGRESTVDSLWTSWSWSEGSCGMQ